MAPVPISAVDAVGPALDRMRQVLFRPVRPALWLRLFVIGLLTGELSSGGGGRLQTAVQLPATLARTAGRPHFLPLGWAQLAPMLPLLIIGLVVAVVLVFVLMYLGTVLRFVLLEAVITGQVRVRQSFRRWRRGAGSLFVLRIWLMLLGWAVMLPLIAVPLLRLWRAGFQPEALLAMLPLLAGVVTLLVVLGLLWLLVWLLIKDFAVPIMAIEELSVGPACRRLWQMLRARPGAFAGYVGMKIVLAVAAGMITTIVVFIVVIVLLIPALLLVGLGAASGGTATAGHALTWALIVAVIAVLIVVAVAVAAAIGVLVMVFFQAYVLRFLAGRYERLSDLLFPPPPLPPEPVSEL
jgi:hypothetical protein